MNIMFHAMEKSYVTIVTHVVMTIIYVYRFYFVLVI